MANSSSSDETVVPDIGGALMHTHFPKPIPHSTKLNKSTVPCANCDHSLFWLTQDNGDNTYTWECRNCRLPRISESSGQ